MMRLVLSVRRRSYARKVVASHWGDDRKASAMGTAARTRMLEHFQWSSVVKRCLEAYRA